MTLTTQTQALRAGWLDSLSLDLAFYSQPPSSAFSQNLKLGMNSIIATKSSALDWREWNQNPLNSGFLRSKWFEIHSSYNKWFCSIIGKFNRTDATQKAFGISKKIARGSCTGQVRFKIDSHRLFREFMSKLDHVWFRPPQTAGRMDELRLQRPGANFEQYWTIKAHEWWICSHERTISILNCGSNRNKI